MNGNSLPDAIGCKSVIVGAAIDVDCLDFAVQGMAGFGVRREKAALSPLIGRRSLGSTFFEEVAH
jgi:hypothetical protein